MDIPTLAIAACPTARRDGWTAERRAAFLECLSEKPDITRACARTGLSRQAAYKLRRRDPVFALAWDVALQVAHDARVRRTLEGVPERTPRTPSSSSMSSTSCH